jgi:hypothetical protein
VTLHNEVLGLVAKRADGARIPNPVGGAVDVKTVFAAVAIAVSLGSVAVTIFIYQRTAMAARKPVLIFEYSKDGWLLRNVGNGPALNVVVARKNPGADWFDPVRVPGFATDGLMRLHWCAHDNEHGLGASYEDSASKPYTATCGDDLSRVFDGNRLPAWARVDQHWKRPPAST